MRHLYLRLLIFFVLLFSVLLSSAQNLVLDTYSGQSEIKAASSVTLKPGFYVPQGSTVRIYTGASFQNCVPLASNPSADRNYILTKVFKIPGVLTDAQANQAGRSTCEVNQTIQYLDGLGRPSQNVTVQGSPSFADVIQPVSYDLFGREDKKYQPYTASSTGGSYRSDALQPGTGLSAFYTSSQAGITPTAYPFSQIVFEASPLNRVVEQGAPGQSWQPVAGSNTGHTSKIDYGTNTSDDAVKLWLISGAGASAANYYTAGTLYKTVSKDENWVPADGHAGTVDEFKDLEGRVVLRRVWENNSKSLSTYYIFSDFGNLSYVLSPAVNENGSSVSSFTESDNVFNQFIYGYHYDGRNRVMEKKIPGKGWEFIVYNALDQVVMSQDANQRSANQWLFSKYDALGRVVITGVYGNASGRAALQTAYDSHAANQGALWESRDNTGAQGTGYTNAALPTSEILEYYTYSYYDDYNFYNNTFGQPNGSSQVGSSRTKGLPIGSRVKVLGSQTMLLSVNYYDQEGRMITSKSENHLGGSDLIDNTYNFAGELTASTRNHSTSAGNGNVVIANRYEYDHMGRKIAIMESINSQGEVVLNKTNYNEIGQPLLKSLHSTDNGTSYLENTSYLYNERGWLSSSLSGNFSVQLKYADGTTPQYNGNIANQLWGPGNLGNTFTYGYDRLNRLTTAASPNLGESIAYDVMGNVTSLSREGYGTNTYSGYAGNQLTQISGFTNSSYAYDANGNLQTDSQKGITIGYNYLNLPNAISGSKTISYTYDASGNKLRKASSLTGTTDYINGIQHKGDGSVDIILTEEGLARNNSGTYSYEYTLTDHLGNNRTTFYKNPNGSLEVLQRDDYFAFGLRRGTQAASNENKYLYNKKELQEELGEYDYGARFYDPVIGRWNVIDPLAEQDRRASPYAYGFDDPIRHTDPDGMFGEDFDDASGPGDRYSNGDQKGYIRNATGYLKRTEPIKAFVADLAHDILDGLGLNAVDDKIHDIRSGSNTARDKVELAYKVFDAVLAISTLPEGGEGKASSKTYQTYTKESRVGGETYSGRTSGTKTPEENIANRDKNHHMNSDFGPAKLDKSSSNRDAIRGREQQLIKHYGGAKSEKGTSGNAINGVGPNNPKKEHYESEANKEFKRN
ncbi:RHS repeat-associated core domain-containing protein [Pedobacter westerhofensis]|uniref:RHS repeat-associated core domain-containing protein n=1 Tax=Pedobacter westerhofensis TaxID=425512 RepID=A0A521C629_9SPHI|nr:RHS repeat-associated core domain-containing protein [Pedobacter westerhofensis]